MGLPLSYFNSIKVQLKRDVQSLQYPRRGFQFHKGTIKTKNLDDYEVQFKYISIP